MDSPLEQLLVLADRCASHDSLQLVLVKAREGAGRSHLLEQLASRRPNTVRVRCSAEGTLGRLLQALTGVAPGGAETQSLVDALSVTPALVALDPERRPLVAQLLASLLAAPLPGSVTAGLDAASRSEGACAQLIHVVSFAAATAPLVLAIDDAHHADAETVAFFDALAHVDTPVPALVVFTADAAPELAECAFLQHQARWPERTRAPTLTMTPLDGATVDGLLQKHGCGPALAARLAALVDGNPSLALGVWAVLQRAPELADKALPLTFDALRVESVRSSGPTIFALAQRACVLGDTFLQRALEATGPIDGLESPLFRRGASGLFGDVIAFADRRVRLALRAQLTTEQTEPWLTAAGSWAAAALEKLPDAFEDAAEHVLPLALRRIDGEEASLWHEAWAGWLARRGRAAEAFDALTAAVGKSSGIRRAALVRRIADAQLLAGQPDKVLITLNSASRATPAATLRPATPAGKVLAAQQRAVLERWETLTGEEANTAIELVRAEAYSHLVRKEDTVKSFGDLERRLEKLQGPIVAHLWIRWAKSWGWFLCEILGRPADALLACEKVRQRVPAEVLNDDAQTLEFLRAQQMACATVGEFELALTLVEELIALSRSRGDLRAQCLAWNARAILHFGQGELPGARRSFDRSLELARATGWKRRAAIATHNLALVLLELGELDAAQAAEERYATLSVAIGNHAATAEAPAVLAGVALARGDLAKADSLISLARKAAESNEWTMLLAWARSLAGRMRVQKYAQTRDSLELSKAKNDFLAALDLFEEHSTAWTEEVDPGEVYALYAATLKLAGQDKPARDALDRGAKNLPAQNVVSLRALGAGRAFVEGKGMDEALAWFESNGYQRFSRLWRQLAG